LAYRIHRDSDWRCGDCVRILQKFCRDFACGPIRSDRSMSQSLRRAMGRYIIRPGLGHEISL
jgi:hypothetical protein